MIATRAAIVAIFAALALIVGWLAPPNADPPVAASSTSRPRVAVVSRPGASVGPAARELARLNPPPVVAPIGPPKPVAAPPPPPPPPPDVASVFRAAVTAVVRDARGLGVVVAPVAGAPQRRVLHIGDLFIDGWRIMALDRKGASLERRGEQRAIAFFTGSAT